MTGKHVSRLVESRLLRVKRWPGAGFLTGRLGGEKRQTANSIGVQNIQGCRTAHLTVTAMLESVAP